MIFLRQSKTDSGMIEIFTKTRLPSDGGKVTTQLYAVVLWDFIYDAGLVEEAQTNVATRLQDGQEVPCNIHALVEA